MSVELRVLCQNLILFLLCAFKFWNGTTTICLFILPLTYYMYSLTKWFIHRWYFRFCKIISYVLFSPVSSTSVKNKDVTSKMESAFWWEKWENNGVKTIHLVFIPALHHSRRRLLFWGKEMHIFAVVNSLIYANRHLYLHGQSVYYIIQYIDLYHSNLLA